MTNQAIPPTLDHFLHNRLAQVDERARLVCVLDAQQRLSLGQAQQVHGQMWPVLRYSGDDLAFRAAFRPDQPTLVWLTQPEHGRPEQSPMLRLSSLADVLAQADEILDLSLEGVLDELAPGEIWPAGALDAYAALFANHLPELVAGHQAVRRYLPGQAALDAAAMRAVALHCLQPDTPAHEFLFQQDSAAGVLDHYISLAWRATWDEYSAGLLREQARLAAQAGAAAWFDAPLDGLACYLYWYRWLTRARLPNVNNQLRGLGLLSFDPDRLEAQAAVALARWDGDAAWRKRLIQQAEANLSPGDVQRTLDLLDLRDMERLWALIGQAESPAVVYELAARLLSTAAAAHCLGETTLAWAENRPAGLETLPQTGYTQPSRALVDILDALAFVNAALASSPPPFANLAAALDWYVQARVFDLELALARAVTALLSIPDAPLRQVLNHYLDHVHRQVGDYLDAADHALAGLIAADWNAYLASPRLSIHVLRDAVLRKRLSPTEQACVWIVIFDGMRWDSWQRVIKPRLLETFELKDEKAYLSLLPSWTAIARTGLLAGQTPAHWQGYRGAFTTHQEVLAARLLGIPDEERDKKLRFYSRMENDTSFLQLDPAQRFPYNVLIFNISDDNLHHLRGNLDQVNQVIAQLLNDILDLLRNLVKPQDTLILSSDHGFTKIEPGQAVTVPDRAVGWERSMEGGRHPVSYRAIAGAPLPGLGDACSFEYKGLREGQYTTAIGRTWFQRQDMRGEAARYAHGGLSLAEMVVPGAVLQPVTHKRLKLSLENLPGALSVQEDQPLRFEVVIANVGNQGADYELSAQANTEAQPHLARGRLPAGERRLIPMTVQPIFRQRGESTRVIHVQLAYSWPDGKLERSLPRDIPVTVTPRKDKVEISFGGLDDLGL